MKLVDLDRIRDAIAACQPLPIQGRVIRASGLVIEVSLPRVAVGTPCEIQVSAGRAVPAEVVGFSGSTALLMPCGDVTGICEGCAVVPKEHAADLPVGRDLLGRVVDSNMRPVDGGPPLQLKHRAPVYAPPPQAMERRRISAPLPLGVKSIDALLTIGEGQRVGVLAGPGAGKSVLLGMVARHTSAEVIVVALVGERGREVREFVERDLGVDGLKRSVVVTATADEPPFVRVRAALAATAVAEYFRSQNKRVLLLVDSLSRVAMAQREIGLAAGEPPTTKGYPPSVFAALPKLLERAGNDAGRGSITALYTVLAEGDDLNDPFVDAAKAALDGHIVLSRALANSGHFPAVDVLASISRVMNDVVDQSHRLRATAARELLAAYAESADLIEVGAYVAGSSARVDRAMKAIDPIRSFLRQSPEQRVDFSESTAQLKTIVDGATR